MAMNTLISAVKAYVAGAVAKLPSREELDGFKAEAEGKYLKKDEAADTYLEDDGTMLSAADASSTYLKKTDAYISYLTKSDAESTYLAIADVVNPAASDWSEDDEGSLAYIKNKPFSFTYSDLWWSSMEGVGYNASATNESAYVYSQSITKTSIPDSLTVVIDGQAHTCQKQTFTSGNTTYTGYGNAWLLNSSLADDGGDVLIITRTNNVTFYCREIPTSFAVYEGFEVDTLDALYLPDTVATKAYVDEALGVITDGSY